jgi:hypothetical protein
VDQHAGVPEVRLECFGDARVLDLHGHDPPVEQDGLVDLADRGGGGRFVLNRSEHLIERHAVVFLFEDLDDGEIEKLYRKVTK